MVLPQAMAWVQYWFRVLSLKFCGKSKKNCGDISQVSPAFCMYAQWFQWPVVPYWTSSIDDNHYWLGLRRPISRTFLRLHQVRQGGLQHVSFHNCCNTSSSILLSRSRWECCQYFCAVLVCALPCLWPPACLCVHYLKKRNPSRR